MPMGWVAAATALTGVLGSEASTSAAHTQADAANKASDNTMLMFDTQQKNLAPWMGTGQEANSLLAYGLGLPVSGPSAAPAPAPTDFAAVMQANGWTQVRDVNNANRALWQSPDGSVVPQEMLQASPGNWGVNMSAVPAAPQQTAAAFSPGSSGITPGMFTKTFSPSDFLANQDPSYGFRLNQGLDAVMNRASVGGGVAGSGGSSPIGGNTLKAINDYAQGSASTEYGAAFDRWNTMMNTIFGRLSGTSGTGANTAGGIAGLGMGAVGAAGGLSTDAAAALAAGKVGSTNALTGAGSSIANNYLLYQMMQNNNANNAAGGANNNNNIQWIEQGQP